MFGSMRVNGLGFLMAFTSPASEAWIREVNESVEFDSAGISSIYIKTSVVHTRVFPCKGKNIQVRLSGGTAANYVRFDAVAINGALRIFCDPEWSVIPVSSDLQLEIAVPEIMVPEFRITTVSSRVEFQFPGARKIDITAASGTVSFSSVQVRDSVFVKNVSGEIFMEGVSVQALSVSNHNGKIALTAVNADEFSVVNSEGPILISGMKALNARIRSVSGKISAVSETLSPEMDVRTSSGAIDLAVPEEGCFSLNARSASGQVSVADIPVAGLVSEHQVAGIAGDKIGRERMAVLLKSGSGTITVRKV
ncbi:MAG: DUF4097 domain-containing protein [Spirochaetaceae bacterium]|jgi:lia operon protein LiaG|nr:DUF4097 domain-containing protein [Spirochaetaceae bacterium]